jgi:predicted RNA-binding Zn-ribbon protein involved in translation (DUF1610 family)
MVSSHPSDDDIPPVPGASSSRPDLQGDDADSNETVSDDHEADDQESIAARGSGDASVHVNKKVYPCFNCGADVVFDIQSQQMKCPYCGMVQQIVHDAQKQLHENDYQAMLKSVSDWRKHKSVQVQSLLKELNCPSCGGTVVFKDTLTSDFCPYCATPLQIENAHAAEQRVPADGVLPFQVERDKAKAQLKTWVQHLWFAPTQFKRMEFEDTFQGLYLSHWTFDAETYSAYTGERGENYTEVIGHGKDRRTVTRTRWYSAQGQVDHFHNDVVVNACRTFVKSLMDRFTRWPLQKAVPFQDAYLAGFVARTYDVELDEAYVEAKYRIDQWIDGAVRADIGGDRQRVNSVQTEYQNLKFKLMLLPVWMLSYRFHNKVYHVVVNGASGEVQGERPWSAWKIASTILFAIMMALIIVAIGQGMSN